MRASSLTPALRPATRALAALGACSLAALCPAHAGAVPGDRAGSSASGATPLSAVTLEQCVTSVVEAERSATFAGEMTAIPGTARMAMRIQVQESLPGEALFHTVTAPGLGVWRDADPKVKIYKYLKQVTNLSSPAAYRALVRFRWLGAKGHVIKRAERVTPRCEQPAAPPASSPSTP
jgi:hypothetical protein